MGSGAGREALVNSILLGLVATLSFVSELGLTGGAVRSWTDLSDASTREGDAIGALALPDFGPQLARSKDTAITAITRLNPEFLLVLVPRIAWLD